MRRAVLRRRVLAFVLAAFVAACGARTDLFDALDDVPDVGTDAFVEPDGDARPPGPRDAALDASAQDAAADVVDAGADSGADVDAGGCTLYVDSVNGSDSFDGSSPFPFKSITKALATASGFDACIPTVQVRPGTYDAANGEIFPLVVPANVTLVGDEARKGDPNGSPVLVRGGGFVYVPVLATLYPGSGATIAGLDVMPLTTGNSDAGLLYGIGVLLYGATSNITVRNNTISGGHLGVYAAGSKDALVTGNVITDCFVGFALVTGGTAKVEWNAATGNTYGFEGDVLGADFGGGALGSAGHNTISCNGNDMFVSVGGIPAMNNYWDHVPPTASAQISGPEDILLYGGDAGPTTTGAMLATPSCP